MKQLKFLKTISCEGKPVWYKDCCYEVVSEGANAQGREMYKLFCEDLKLRGIDIALADKFYKVIEIQIPENKVEEINKEDSNSDIIIEEKQEEIKIQKPKISSNKKRKSSKK